MQDNRLSTLERQETDHMEGSLRPQFLKEFIGQEDIKENLRVFIEASKRRGKSMDHTLLYGPPGLGKTTLSQIIARELGVQIKITSGPTLTKSGDLAAILTNLQAKDVLFVDEIHRLPISVEEILYSAMEDFKLDIVIGEGPSARSIRIDLPEFTLIGATTRSGLISNPLRDRFGIPLGLSFYSPEELALVVHRTVAIIGMQITTDGALEIAKRSRGTPRIAIRLLKRICDFCLIGGVEKISKEHADKYLTKLDVDKLGLDKLDRKYLQTMADFYKGGPVGIDTMATILYEQRDTIEDVIEPYLVQKGFVLRTPRGRMLSMQSWEHLGLTPATNILKDLEAIMNQKE